MESVMSQGMLASFQGRVGTRLRACVRSLWKQPVDLTHHVTTLLLQRKFLHLL